MPLPSSPGSIDQVLGRPPELGGGLSSTFEPGQTTPIATVALGGRLLVRRTRRHEAPTLQHAASSQTLVEQQLCAYADAIVQRVIAHHGLIKPRCRASSDERTMLHTSAGLWGGKTPL
jgi:hypothetical protein